MKTCSNCGNRHPAGFGFDCVSVDRVHPPYTCDNWKPLKEITLTINQLPESLNKILNMHWTRRSKYNQMWHLLIQSEVSRLGLTKIKGCVIMKYHLIFDNKHRHDPDNYIGGFKPAMDKIRECLLEDDNMDIVKGIEFSYEVGKERKTIISIRSC